MKKFFKISIFVVIGMLLIAFVAGIAFYVGNTRGVNLKPENLGYKETSVSIFDDNINMVKKVEYVDEYVPFDKMPKHLSNAFISIEDKRFYKHHGVDYYRIMGAVVSNLKQKGVFEGASTISQQLIKNTHLTSEKSLERKLQEIKLAKQLEKKFNKQEILEMYLNVIYFGNGIYGVGNASHRLFNKDVSNLSLGECATLAGIIKNPSKYSPVLNYENSQERKQLILRYMKQQNFITQSEYDDSVNVGVTITYSSNKKSDYKSYMKNVLAQASIELNMTPQEILNSEYKIYTYLKSDIQEIVSRKVYDKEFYYANSNGIMPDGTAIVLDNITAGVNAYCSTSPYSVFKVMRQPGSAIKPISVYAPALENDIIYPITQVLDEETTFNEYAPKNYNEQYFGWVSARFALEKSLNIPAVKILSYLGPDRALGYMQKFGLKTDGEDSSLALALGGTRNGSNVLQMAAAYRVFSENGVYVAPSFISRIEDKNGNIVYQHELNEVEVMSPENSYLMLDMLKGVVQNGTAVKLNSLGFDIASKTGTVASSDSNYNSDAWSCSLTNDITMVVWQGNVSNEKEKMLDKGITGGAYPTMMARDIYREIYQGFKPMDFTKPIGVIDLKIDKKILENEHIVKIASELTPDDFVIADIFAYHNQPKETSEYFTNPKVEDFRAVLDGKEVNISFIADERYKYEIFREVQGNNKSLLKVESQKGEIEFTDKPKEGLVKYIIYPTLITETEDIEGTPSRILVIVKDLEVISQNGKNKAVFKNFENTIDVKQSYFDKRKAPY